MTTEETPAARLDYLRGELRAASISYGELAELHDLREHIEPGDVELLEAAGVPEHPETITEYVERRGITLTIEHGPVTTEDAHQWEHNAYTVALHLDGETITMPYKRGMALSAMVETTEYAAEVLNSLLIDAEAGAETFEDYCANFGEDPDSRRAFATWESCSATRLRLIGWLGGADSNGLDEMDALANIERP